MVAKEGVHAKKLNYHVQNFVNARGNAIDKDFSFVFIFIQKFYVLKLAVDISKNADLFI